MLISIMAPYYFYVIYTGFLDYQSERFLEVITKDGTKYHNILLYTTEKKMLSKKIELYIFLPE